MESPKTIITLESDPVGVSYDWFGVNPARGCHPFGGGRAGGRVTDKQPKLSAWQQKEFCRMHATDECGMIDFSGLF